MASEYREEARESAPIPRNFAAGNTFLGYEIKWLNLIQAFILGSIPLYVSYGIVSKYFYTDATYQFSITITAMIGFAIFGYFGIDNITPFEYIWNVLNFRKRKRKTFYNPRVKTEYKSIFVEKTEGNQILPKEKIMEFYKKYIEKRNQIDQQNARALFDDEYDDTLYFEEDFAVLDKPEEYMTKKEIKEKHKKQKEVEKKKLKENSKKAKKSKPKKKKGSFDLNEKADEQTNKTKFFKKK